MFVLEYKDGLILGGLVLQVVVGTVKLLVEEHGLDDWIIEGSEKPPRPPPVWIQGRQLT